MPTPKPFPEQVRTLAREKGVSVGSIAYQAYSPSAKGTSPDTLRKVMAGKRRLNEPLIEAIAGVLEVAPEEFTEYRLSRLRHALNESETGGVGFAEAAELLGQIERALGAQVVTQLAERATRARRRNGAAG